MHTHSHMLICMNTYMCMQTHTCTPPSHTDLHPPTHTHTHTLLNALHRALPILSLSTVFSFHNTRTFPQLKNQRGHSFPSLISLLFAPLSKSRNPANIKLTSQRHLEMRVE